MFITKFLFPEVYYVQDNKCNNLRAFSILVQYSGAPHLAKGKETHTFLKKNLGVIYQKGVFSRTWSHWLESDKAATHAPGLPSSATV